MDIVLKRVSFGVVCMTLPLILLFYSLEIAAFDKNFYPREYEKHRVSQNTGIQEEELSEITDALLAYLKGERQDLEVYGEVHGSERLIFDERDQAHMVDVQELFLRGFALKRILLFLLGSALLFMGINKYKIELARAVFLSSALTIGLICLLGLIIATDFSKYFDLFHEIFFSNDLWRLDPDKSILINLVPLGFFMDIVIRIGIYFFGSLGVILLGSGYYLRRNRLGTIKNLDKGRVE